MEFKYFDSKPGVDSPDYFEDGKHQDPDYPYFEDTDILIVNSQGLPELNLESLKGKTVLEIAQTVRALAAKKCPELYIRPESQEGKKIGLGVNSKFLSATSKHEISGQISFAVDFTDDGNRFLVLNRDKMKKEDYSIDQRKIDLVLGSRDILPEDPEKGTTFKINGALDSAVVQKAEVVGFKRFPAYKNADGSDYFVNIPIYRFHISTEDFEEAIGENGCSAVTPEEIKNDVEQGVYKVTEKVMAVLEKYE